MAQTQRDKADKNFDFELVSPAKVEVRSFETKVVLPSDKGEFMVLPGHTRLITNLCRGVIRVIRGDQDAHQIYITGGFADIGPDHCTVLATEATPVHKLDVNALNERLSILQDDLNDEQDGIKTAQIEKEIDAIKHKLFVLEKQTQE